MADVISTQEVFASSDNLRETWEVASEVAQGTALVQGDLAGVAFTPSGGYTASKVMGPYTISGIPAGGASLDALEVSVSRDGSHAFAVTGVTGSTTNGTPVYAVVAAGKVTSLTLTASTNTLFGHVNQPAGQAPSASSTSVKIGG